MFYFVIGAIALYYAIYFYVFKIIYNYWKAKNVKGPNPLPLVGNFGNVMMVKETIEQFGRKVYEAFPKEKVVGLYQAFKPVLLIRDPELIKQVLIKDFDNFQDRGVQPARGLINENLFSSKPDKWRILRQKLTPVFTSKKLKNMVPLMEKCVNDYVTYINGLIDNNMEEEIRSLQSKLTLEVIGSCAFGLDLHTFSNENNEFVVAAKNLLVRSPVFRILFALDMIFPGIRNKLTFIPDNLSDSEDFFVGLVKQIVNERGNKPSMRNDFMDLMIELKEQGKVGRQEITGISEMEIDEAMIAAQAFVFYFAGFETSAATTSFLLYELALHPDIQERLYKEVNGAFIKNNNKIDYELLSELNYLEMVFDETLRKYPVVGALVRKSLADYTLPGTDINIQKGTSVFISVSGLHNDPSYFPNPSKFDPERFSKENKINIPPCVYLPFGDGPRNCIGMRFARAQSMLSIATLVKNFKVIPTNKTQQPLTYSSKGLTMTSEKGIWLKILKRNVS